jgi:hypothetical protein
MRDVPQLLYVRLLEEHHRGTIKYKAEQTTKLFPFLPDKESDRFPGGGPPIAKGDERPKGPPAGLVQFTLNTLMEDDPLFSVPYGGGKTSRRTIGFLILNQRRINIFQVGKGLDGYP